MYLRKYTHYKKLVLVLALPRRCRCWLHWICLIVSSLLLIRRVANRCRGMCRSKVCRECRCNTSGGGGPSSSGKGNSGFIGHRVCDCGCPPGCGPVRCSCGIEECVVRRRARRGGRSLRTSTACCRLVLEIPAPIWIRLTRTRGTIWLLI